MKKIDGLIAVARKAGFVVIGAEKLRAYTKKLYILLLDKTAGTSLKRQMGYIAGDRQIPLLEIENLGRIVGIENCKAIGIKNKAFGDEIAKCLKGE